VLMMRIRLGGTQRDSDGSLESDTHYCTDIMDFEKCEKERERDGLPLPLALPGDADVIPCR
jgi:hypothetical protein